MYKLYNGDCLNVMDKLIEEGIEVDMILTDPPFGTTNCKWDSVIPFDKMWDRLNKLIKPNGAIVLFGSEPFSSALRMSNIKNYKYDWVWNKIKKGHPLNSKKRPFIINENISIFMNCGIWYNPQFENKTEDEFKKNISKKSKKINKYNDITNCFEIGKCKIEKKSYPTNILNINSISKECNMINRLHPTQKPVALLEYLIKTYTNENELVLDFTAGSGSTGVACANTNRKFIGIELDENYFNIANKRIHEAYMNME